MKLKLSKPEILWNCKTFLGEGITYDSQKKTIYFAPNGAAIYITSKKNIKKFILGGDKIVGFQMPDARSIDVDNLEDLNIAKILFKKNA